MKKIFFANLAIFAFWFCAGQNSVFAADCSNWTTVSDIGGVIKYEPAVMATSDGKLVVAAIGNDNALWVNEFDPQITQNEWYSLGGVLVSGPNLLTSADGKIVASAMGSNNTVWQRIRQSSKNWTEWQNTGFTNFVGAGPSQTTVGGSSYRAVKTVANSVKIEKCADAKVCASGAVSGCKVCKPDGSGWIDDNSKCARGQSCQSGICFIPETPLSKDLFGYGLSAGANVMGSNSLDSYGRHCWIPNSNENNIIMQSAKKMHLRILRLPILAYAADNTDCWGIANIKRFLDAAQSYGLKVIIELDGYTKYEGYCDWKAGFVNVRAGAAKIVAALKGHPALFAWDLLNEPLWGADNSRCASAADHESVIKAVYSMHELVRSIDPETPLTVGEGKDEYLNIWNKITNFASPHIYSSWEPGAELVQVQNRLMTLKNIAGPLPLVIGEFGISVPPLTEADRTQQFRGIYQTLKSSDIGGIFWLLSPETGDDMENFSLISGNGIFKDAGNTVMQSLLSYNDARLIDQSVPIIMVADKNYSISITLGNTGTDNWTEAQSFRLGSQNPQDNGTWRDGRVYLAAGESIAPGQSKTFTFNVKAPATPGTYNFQWQMLREGVEWFGEKTSNVAVTVTGSSVCVPKTCTSLGDYHCGSWSDSCGATINCGTCASGKTCNPNGQCVSQTTGGPVVTGPGPQNPTQKTQVQQKLTRDEILTKIAEIKKLLIQLIIQLIAELQKQLVAMPK